MGWRTCASSTPRCTGAHRRESFCNAKQSDIRFTNRRLARMLVPAKERMEDGSIDDWGLTFSLRVRF